MIFDQKNLPKNDGYDKQKWNQIVENIWNEFIKLNLIKEKGEINLPDNTNWDEQYSIFLAKRENFMQAINKNLEEFSKNQSFFPLIKTFFDEFMLRVSSCILNNFFIKIAEKCDFIIMETNRILGEDLNFVSYEKISRNIKREMISTNIENMFKFYEYDYYKVCYQNEIQNKLDFKVVDDLDFQQPQRQLYEIVRPYFEIKTETPQDQQFILNPNEGLCKEIFESGYAKSFLSDLSNSYSSYPICSINDKDYEFKTVNTTVEDIFFQFGLDLSNKLKLISSLSELFYQKNESLQELRNQIINELCRNNKLYESIVDSNDFTNDWKMVISLKMNINEKISIILRKWRDIGLESEANSYEQIQSILNNLKNPSLKIRAKKVVNESGILDDEDELLLILENISKESSISDFILFKYIEWQKNSNNLIYFLKWLMTYKNINLEIYKKKDSSHLLLIEKYSNFIDSKVIIRLIYENGNYQILELFDIKADGRQNNFNSGSGYLQTTKNIYNMTRSIDDFKNALESLLVEFESKYKELWITIEKPIHDIHKNCTSSILFYLNRYIGRLRYPSKKEILKSITNKEILQNLNIYLSCPIDTIISQIKLYAIYLTLIQQIQKSLTLIIKYQAINSKQNNQIEDIKLVKDLLIQDLASTILAKRCFNINDNPEFLLFELENNILIRENQKCLIYAMKNKDQNGIYQLNMGEGKTSVILILLANLLCDGNTITRINVLESLYGIMQELLKIKFCGFLEKKIYIMPFTRNVNFTLKNLKKIKEILDDCKQEKNILLMTPEQRLCFQLKLQEIFMDYLQTKDADNHFDWEMVPHLHSKKNVIKQMLEDLKYIKNNDQILKFPENFWTFYEEIKKEREKRKIEIFFGLFDLYDVLRKKSKDFRGLLESQLQIFKEISDYKFLDILDESDEILQYGKELNYTLGQSSAFDGGDYRWEIPFMIMRIIFNDRTQNNEVWKLLLEGMQDINNKFVIIKEWDSNEGIGGGVPLIRFGNKAFFNDKIKPILAKKLCKEILKKFDITREPDQQIININGVTGTYIQFILGELAKTECNMQSPEMKIVEHLERKNCSLLHCLLIAKAWITHGLLYHVLSFRYRVQYGLVDDKEIAIPFKGKDLPSLRSEFSHPEVMIGFTIISYFYNGLRLYQVKRALVKLKEFRKQYGDKSLNDWVEKSKGWISSVIKKSGNDFPDWLRSFENFEIDIPHKVDQARIYLGKNIEMIQYYLENFIFPEKCKLYKRKLTGNAHDLAGEGIVKGFSGTNDRDDTMPERVYPTIQLPDQKHTNGKMIHLICREANKKYTSVSVKSTKEFLNKVTLFVSDLKNKCYILIDSGAIITEMSNLQVATYLRETWIQNNLCQMYQGIIYFCDETNRIKVLLRNGENISLSSCHLDNRGLFVYLDEVHTRGTDLKLPPNAKGIVTIGKHMTKDKFMQAVMRLRQLDHMQSIEIWGSDDITAEIAGINRKTVDKCLTSEDVLIWLTHNTIVKNEKDLFPVLIEKMKYIVKKRALDYQKKIGKIPIQSLIKQCEINIFDQLKISYGTTPVKKLTTNLINNKKNIIFGFFWEKFFAELRETKYKDENIPSEVIRKADMNNDIKTIDKIIENLKDKLPDTIETTNDDFDTVQENEKEVEEVQIVEVIPIKKKEPSIEKSWDPKLLNEHFFERSITKTPSYPPIIHIKKCLKYTDIDDILKLKWMENIYATKNFRDTIQITKKVQENQEYQNDYLRPLNVFLVIEKEKTLNDSTIYQEANSKNRQYIFILLSGYEANMIINNSDLIKNDYIFMIFLHDINGPTIFPFYRRLEISPEVEKCIILMKLFNGECKYTEAQQKIIEKLLGVVRVEAFGHNTNIYRVLEDNNYISKNYITHEFANKLTDMGNLELDHFNNKENYEIRKVLINILKESIAQDFEMLSRLREILKKIVEIRGNSQNYEHSDLQKILKI